MEYKTTSAQATENLGGKFVGQCRGGDVVALYGDLGSGKTTFAKGFAKGLGITKRIISPTFPIIRTYKLEKETAFGIKYFYHIDLYRIESTKEIAALGMDEFLSKPKTISVIEWPEKMRENLPKKRWDIFFEYISENERKIRVLERG